LRSIFVQELVDKTGGVLGRDMPLQDKTVACEGMDRITFAWSNLVKQYNVCLQEG
jgi:hypothetical protein